MGGQNRHSLTLLITSIMVSCNLWVLKIRIGSSTPLTQLPHLILVRFQQGILVIPIVIENPTRKSCCYNLLHQLFPIPSPKLFRKLLGKRIDKSFMQNNGLPCQPFSVSPDDNVQFRPVHHLHHHADLFTFHPLFGILHSIFHGSFLPRT